MLIHKDLKGGGDLNENTALKALLQVGNEFMTERNVDSEVQRSGEFVSMKRNTLGEVLRWVGLWELADGVQRNESGDFEWLTDGQVPAPYGSEQFVARSRFVLGTMDLQDHGALPSRSQNLRQHARQPRNTAVLGRVVDVDNQATQARKRLFSLGDGTLMLVRELTNPDDTRWLGGANAAGLGIQNANRVSKVQVLRLRFDVELNKFQSAVLMEFDVHSGLGFDPSGLQEVYSAPTSALHDSTHIYLGNCGFMWGRLFDYSAATADQSGYYAVSEPAMAKDGNKPYLSVVAVHGLPQDARNSETSALFRLTCTFSTAQGVETSKIAMPTTTGQEGELFWAPYGLRLYRLGPLKLMLRAWVAAQRLSGSMAQEEATQVAEVCWITEDGGESWDMVSQADAGNGVWGTRGSWLVRDSESCIKVRPAAMTTNSDFAANTSCRVFEVDAAGARQIAEIPMSLFNAGLHEGFASGDKRSFPEYEPVGEGGSIVIEGVHTLWLQFDPVLRLRPDYPGNIDYPSSRPMVLLSSDGGITWRRLLLPSPWPHQVGFVLAADAKTLVVPVYAPRLTPQGLETVPVRLHACKDGQEWKSTKEKFKLPAYAWIDGQMGGAWEGGQSNTVAFAFNRGELSPLVQVHDANGIACPINPARPWIANALVEVPYGQ